MGQPALLLLVVVYCHPDNDTIHIISARKALPHERKNMKPEYDFSKGKRGAVIPPGSPIQVEVTPGKTRITTYIDSDIMEALKTRGEVEHKGYQTVLNELLRKQFETEKPLEEVLRKVIREELKKAA